MQFLQLAKLEFASSSPVLSIVLILSEVSRTLILTERVFLIIKQLFLYSFTKLVEQRKLLNNSEFKQFFAKSANRKLRSHGK